jgi:hypothetical protein
MGNIGITVDHAPPPPNPFCANAAEQGKEDPTSGCWGGIEVGLCSSTLTISHGTGDAFISMDIRTKSPTWLELESVRPLSEAEQITSLDRDTLLARYRHLCVRVYPRRCETGTYRLLNSPRTRRDRQATPARVTATLCSKSGQPCGFRHRAAREERARPRHWTALCRNRCQSWREE